VPSERIHPRQWLSTHPLQAGEHLYSVLGNASSASPLAALCAEPDVVPIALWKGTPYAAWLEVMPFLAQVRPDSKFLDWIAATESNDWGWLAVSSADPAHIHAHLSSLTQVLLPNGQAVFLRFWDGNQLLPIFDFLGTEVGRWLPVFRRYLINGRCLQFTTAPLHSHTSPWWEVPSTLLQHMAEANPQLRLDNLLNALSLSRPDLYAAFPAPQLRLKVSHFLRGRPPSDIPQALIAFLSQERG
jgi:hypothetical protein